MATRGRKDKLGLSLASMISSAKSGSKPPFAFPDWVDRLRSDESLTPGLRESYRQTLTQFGEFCRKRTAGASVAQAREYVELERLARAPSRGRLQEWSRKALRATRFLRVKGFAA